MSHNVFKDLGFSSAEAKILEFKSQLVLEIKKVCEKHSITRRSLEKIWDVPQPRVSNVMTGKIDKVSVERLLSFLIILCDQCGEDVNIQVNAFKAAL
jgi:predicted XRE-type DNA-binding protein